MIAKIITDTEVNMRKKIEHLKAELAKLRTGRAHPSLLEHVKVDYYGQETPLAQVASITASDARTLTVSPWEKNLMKPIEKAIRDAGLGLNPVSDSAAIRVPMPPLTEERRKEMVKLVKVEGENTKVNIRNLRRDANNAFKEILKKKEISEDEEHRAQDQVQKVTDKLIVEVDKILSVKESELMEV
jgi:ribosome recycling factor